MASSRPPEPSPLDHLIAQRGGTTSTLELLPSRLQRSKQIPPDARTRLVELTREISMLREEAACLKRVRNVFANFHAKAFDVYTVLHDARERTSEAFANLRYALQDLSDHIASSEEGLRRYWNIDLDGSAAGDVKVY